MAQRFFLTKSDFVRYLVCPAWAWTVRHDPDRLPPADANQQRAFDRGYEVEAMALRLFPGGVEIGGRSMADAARQTRAAIRAGERTLFQATVMTPFGLLARADVLRKEDDGWHIYEVKSSTASRSEPRKIQKRYLDDIGFQVHAFRDAGIPIARGSILHLDGRYRRNGSVDLAQMFQATDMTAEVTGIYAALARKIEQAIADLTPVGNPPSCLCHTKAKSNRCEAFTTFHPEFPARNSVLDLRVGKDKLRAALERGITSLLDWPDDLPLTEKQRAMVEFRRGSEPQVDVAALRRILGAWAFPLHFYDYETFATPMPMLEGVAPYEPVPFQYSLHIVHEDGRMGHREFLWTKRGEDPVPHLARRLKEDVLPRGTLLAWNAGYEKGCNARMAERYPAFADVFDAMNARTQDAAEVITSGAWQHPAFHGSWSLKTVTPVAAPDLDYKVLEIGEGGLAAERWTQAMLDDTSAMEDIEREAIFAALRIYCHLDTLAMVRVWHRALELSGGSLMLREIEAGHEDAHAHRG